MRGSPTLGTSSRMKSLVEAGLRLPVDPLLEPLGLLFADDYFGVGITVQAQYELAAEVVAQIADALHADDVLAVGAEEAGRVELAFEFVHAHGNSLRGAVVEMQAHDFVLGGYVVYLPYRNGLVAVAVRQQEPLAVAATALLQGLEELAQVFVRCVAAAASDLLDRCGEFVCVYGFEQVVEAVVLERLHGVFVVGGREDDRHGGRRLFQRLETQSVREADVREDEVGRRSLVQVFRRRFDGRQRTVDACFGHDLFQQPDEPVGVALFVFENKDMFHANFRGWEV